MRRTQYFLPTIKENPKEASIASHRLMLRAGLISQTNSGIYSWLPYGTALLQNISNIIRKEHNKIGAQEIIMPTIQPANLWKESGRYNSYGKELLKIKDRHDSDLLYAPTAEEVLNDLVRRYIKSYKELPHILYQIHWKFRDEIRPRFGVMRGREFLMKDAYSIDIDQQSAQATYFKMLTLYINIFKKFGLTAIPLRADTGPIGGDLSHEFHIISQTGESNLYYDEYLETLIAKDLDSHKIDKLMNIYASTDEIYDKDDPRIKNCKSLKQSKGIEVGHIFYYGTKYSEILNVNVASKEKAKSMPYGGCYGIGVSRLAGAIIETSNDERGIILPENISPFVIGIINIKSSDIITTQLCEECYYTLRQVGIKILYDDRNESAGVKFADMDLIGIPWQLIISDNSIKSKKFELKNRKNGIAELLSIEEICNKFSKKMGNRID